MEELKLILMRKAKIIGELKYPKRSNREATLKYLKSVKKQEKKNEMEDLQVIISLCNFNFQSNELFQQIMNLYRKVYFLSFTVMKGLCKNFQFIPEEREIFNNIVQMHYKFYLKEEVIDKAEEIRLAFRKKSFEKGIFVKNLLTWLYDWSKRKLDRFLNNNILSIEKDLLADKLESPKKLSQTPQREKKTMPIKDSIFQGSFMNIAYSQKLWKSEKPEANENIKIIINGNTNLFGPQKETFEIGPFISHQITEDEEEVIIDPLSQRIETSFEPERSSEMAPANFLVKQRSRSYNRDYAEKNSVFSNNLNKEIFYGTYWKEINQLYRNINCLEDLDSYYLKTFKKQKEERKEELVKNRIDQIIEFMVKNMPKIKKSIETYDAEYAKYCPTDIKDFHTESSKILEQENKKKMLMKNQNLKKSQQRQTFELQKYNEKIKSQQNIHPNELPQKLTKKTAIHRLRERNKSLNDGILRKSTQQKVQMQVKLPIVYNPENLYSMAESDAQKALAIHQKFEKFLVNGARPNKGLVRYKQLSKDRQKNHAINELTEDKNGLYESTSIDNKKHHEYEVVNIRKILRKREKERMFVNKTPTYESSKEDEIMDKIMLHIKAMETKYDNEFGSSKKTDKFDIFLSNLKNGVSSPFGLKTSVRSTNLTAMKNSQLDYRLDFKTFNDDFLPKIS